MMTTGDEPTVSMRLDDNGGGEVVVDGQSRPIEAESVEVAREEALSEVRRLAEEAGDAVPFTTDEPGGRWRLVMQPDGKIVDPTVPASPAAPVIGTAESAPTQTSPPEASATEPSPEQPPADESPAAISPATPTRRAVPAEATGWELAEDPTAPDVDETPTERPSATYDSAYVLNSIVPVTRVARSTQGVRGLLGIGPGKREMSERRDRVESSQSYGRPMTVVVADPRGGSGKTTTSLLLAGALGVARGGGVLTLENHELRGTMHLRTEAADGGTTIRDLLRVHGERTATRTLRLGDLSGFVRHQVAGQFDVLVSATKSDRALGREEFESVHELVARFYQMIIIDTANNESAENWRAAIEKADALVVPVKWRNDYSMPAIEMLEELQNSGDPHQQSLVRRAVVVATHSQGDLDPRCRQHLMPYFADRTQAVIEIAPDRHIAEGNVIQHDQLSRSTRRAADRAAAEVAKAIRLGLSEELAP